MLVDRHRRDGVEIAFVCVAAVSFVILIASVAWLFVR